MLMNEQEPKKKKSNILLRLLALLVTMALMLGALFLVVYRDRYNLDAVKRWMSMRSVETDESGEGAPFTHAGGEDISFACLSDGVMMTSTAGIHYYSFSGEQYAEQVTTMEHPVLTASASTGVAYDAGGDTVYLYRGGQESRALTLEGGGEVLSARINDSGWLAVTSQGSGYKGVVTVYNSDFEEVFRVKRSSTFLVDAMVSPDCKTVAVVTMGQQSGQFESQLLIYRLDSEDHLAQVDLGNMAALDLEYEGEQIWVLGENALVSVAVEGWEKHSYSFGRSYLKGCSLGGDGFALVLLGRYRAGSADQALTILPDGQAQSSLSLRSQVLSFDAQGRYLCLLTGGQLNIYPPDMAAYRTLEDAQGARFVSLAANGSALLADRQQAWLYIPG